MRPRALSPRLGLRRAVGKVRARLPLDGPSTWDRIWKTLKRDEPFVYIRAITKSGQTVLGTVGRGSWAALSPQPRDLYIEQVLRPVRSPQGRRRPPTHRAHIIETGDESWRFRHGLARQRGRRGRR
jgi:Family of unknown function (DUF6338)